jgi:RimJ/RimL family protein N-acetyltransferase
VSAGPSPVLEKRGIGLRPIRPEDFEHLRQAEFLTLKGRWRTRGSTPTADSYAALVSQGVLVQALAFRGGSGGDRSLVGWYQLYNVEHDQGVGSIGMASFDWNGSAAFTVGAILFVDYCFSLWPLRKMYVEVPRYNEHVISSFNDALVEEGCLRERVFYMGEFVDVGIYSLGRGTWDELDLSAHL